MQISKKTIFQAIEDACKKFQEETKCSCFTNGEFCPLKNMIICTFEDGDNQESETGDIYQVLNVLIRAEEDLQFITEFLLNLQYIPKV